MQKQVIRSDGNTKPRGWWHEDARALSAAGMTTTEIARRIGVTPSAVYKALRPDAAKAYSARDVARRSDPNVRERRRQIDRAWQRRPENRGICATCGGPMGISSGRRPNTTHCGGCIQAAADQRAAQIVELYEAGMAVRDIADRLNTTTAAIRQDVIRLRKAGRVGYHYASWARKAEA
jgi:IS30 family transposase